MLVDIIDAADSLVDAAQPVSPNDMRDLLTSFVRGYRFALTSPVTQPKDCNQSIAHAVRCASNAGRPGVVTAVCISDSAVLNRDVRVANAGPSDHAAVMVAFEAYARVRARHLLLTKPVDIAKRTDVPNGFLLLCSTPDPAARHVVLEARRVKDGPVAEKYMRKAGRSGVLLGSSSGLGIHFVFSEYAAPKSQVVDASFAYAHGVLLARLHAASGNPVNNMATWIDDVATPFADRLFGYAWCKEFLPQ